MKTLTMSLQPTPAESLNETLPTANDVPPLPVPRKLTSAGECTTCKKDAQTEFLTCHRCLDRFHVLSCTGEDQCTPTFLNNQWPNIKKKYQNIQYICTSCHENVNLNKEDILVNRLASMEKMLTLVMKKLSDMGQPVNTAANTTPQAGQSFADKVKSSVIIIEKKPGEAEDDHTNGLRQVKQAAVESSAAVLSTYQNKVGNTVVVCRSEESKKKLLPHVTAAFNEHKVHTPPPRLPTITITGIENEYSREELFQVIKNQNKENLTITEENFRVIFVKSMVNRDHLYQAVVRVSEEVRYALESMGNRVCIGLSSCRIYDRWFVRRCNRCQGFNHFHKECPLKTHSVCGKCSEQHDTRSCESEVTRCINCVKNKKTLVDHETSWSKCPSYLLEQEKIKKTINYYAKN